MKWFFLLIFCFIWLLGCNTDLLRSVYKAQILQDDYRYGDLYRLSNLPQFKELTSHCSDNQPLENQQNTHLYIIGDSFTEPTRLDSTEFGVGRYTYMHWDDLKPINLDTSARNVLIMESVERHFGEHFAKETPPQPLPLLGGASGSSKSSASMAPPPMGRAVRRCDWGGVSNGVKAFEQTQSKIEEKLEAVLFSNDFMLWFKEKKAWFNYHILGRTNDQVVVTPNGQHLLFAWDIDSTSNRSCFSELTDNEVDELVKVTNKNQEIYKKIGFDEVYLSVIPNKTSIVAPDLGVYNRLVEKIQNHSKLQVPIISVWPYFSTHRNDIYYKSDTHWNCNGQRFWVNEVKGKLAQKP